MLIVMIRKHRGGGDEGQSASNNNDLRVTFHNSLHHIQLASSLSLLTQEIKFSSLSRFFFMLQENQLSLILSIHVVLK